MLFSTGFTFSQGENETRVEESSCNTYVCLQEWQDDIALCWPYSENHGHYYYKCPARMHHDLNFHFYDEYHQNDPPHLKSKYVITQELQLAHRREMEESTTSQPQVVAITTNMDASRLRSDLEKEITFIFMAIVLIMLGIVIGILV